MQSVKDDTIGAFNSYIDTMKKDNPKAVLSLTLFDTIGGITTIINNKKITEVEPLDGTTYRPNGMTNLYDAIGYSVNLLDAVKGKAKSLVILTDGQENASKEHTKTSIKKLLDERQEKDNWLVQYLGANQDAFEEGQKLGVTFGNSMTFKVGKMDAVFKSMSRSATSYAASGSLSEAAYTAEERFEANSD